MNRSVKTLILLSILSLSLLSVYTLRRSHDRTLRAPDILNPFDIEVYEDHKDALDHWVRKGFRNAVLLNIDAHDDIQRVPAENMNRIRDFYGRTVRSGPDTNGPGRAGQIDRLINNSNFINAAVSFGIIKRVVWIVPSTYDLFRNSKMQLVFLLKTYGFSNEDVQTFKMKDGCFRGRAFEVPLDICDINSLPDLKEPVLLSIDADYFPLAVNDNNYRVSESVKNTVNRIFNKGYQIQDTVVAYSVNGGFLNTTHRWVGDLTVDLIRDPGMRSGSELPEHYSVLQRADLLLSMNRYGDLLDYLLPYLKKDEKDPALNMYVAKAYNALGKFDRSFVYAEKAGLAEINYCYGLPELGSNMLDDQGLVSAERFFVRGYEMCPEMDYRQFIFAFSLKQSGRYEDAIKYFKVFRDFYGSFPVDFYIAEAYLLKGDEISALKYYDSARTGLSQDPEALTSFGDLNIIEKAVSFYEKKGYNDLADELSKIMEHNTAESINLSMFIAAGN